MAQLIRLSRKCHQFFSLNHYSKRCIFKVPQYSLLSSRSVQTLNEESFKSETRNNQNKDELESRTTQVIDLKAPYKPPDLSPEKNILLKDNDPDTFGTLSEKVRTIVEVNEMPEEEDDVVETTFINEKGDVREHNMEYAKKIAKLIEENKIIDALNVLDVEMKQVGARPANYIYTLLIGACGRIGNTQKAFKLYAQMRKRGLKVTQATYTGLINACAMCRDSKQGLERINFLRDKMRENLYEMNEANYNAVIKVFGRHGKLSAAFTIVDEMLEKKVRPSLTTFNFLLQACISDSEAGFRHALLTWHKMRSRRVTPDLFSYNLLLRATRECGLGDEDATRLVIDALISPENQAILELNERSTKPFPANSNVISDSKPSSREQSSSSFAHSTPTGAVPDDAMSFEDAISEDLPESIPPGFGNTVDNRPNLISREPHLGSVIGVGEVKSPQDRLLLLGGVSGVLEEMSQDMVSPTIKTFTLLLACIPSSTAVEKQLLYELKQRNIAVDTTFCNMLIKKRCFRGENEKAKAVLDLFQEYRLEPDLITYGCLALTCETHDLAKDFIENLSKSGYRLNKEMLSAMLGQACHRYDLHYLERVLTMFLDYEIQPDRRVMDRLKDFIMNGLKVVETIKKNEPLVGSYPGVIHAPWFRGEFFRLLRYHNKWASEVVVEEETDYEAQFRRKKSDGENVLDVRRSR